MLEGPVDSDLPALHKYGYDPEQTRKSTLSRLGFEQDTAWVLAADPQWRTNGRLRDVISARDVFHEWIDIFVRHQQDRERAGLPHDLLEADHMAGFWAAMPQVQVAISIKTRYQRNPRRTWKSNDIADIDAMSIAYPYCPRESRSHPPSGLTLVGASGAMPCGNRYDDEVCRQWPSRSTKVATRPTTCWRAARDGPTDSPSSSEWSAPSNSRTSAVDCLATSPFQR
jgi:hypothetical protein